MKCMRLLQAGGSGVLVSPLTYIFDEETPRYRQMLDALKAWILFLMGKPNMPNFAMTILLGRNSRNP